MTQQLIVDYSKDSLVTLIWTGTCNAKYSK